MPLLTLDKISKTFGGVAAVRNVSLTAEVGEILGVMGPNGSGKTTLFNLVSGALVPDRGEIRFLGERVNGLAPHQICRRGAFVGIDRQGGPPADQVQIGGDTRAAPLFDDPLTSLRPG